ncbi:MAG: TlyA family rRNA (cytidine-2'-O)-methyltransferase [Acidobacteria bacterium]|nr:MAG: TlyA family rRNA (cytidine-2'-O)-methyltransferase [Acidobacteriota bacterium]
MTVKARPHLAKKRLDVLLVERGLIESRQKAQAIILAGEVRVNGQRAEKTGATFPVDAQVEIAGKGSPFASRAGDKLDGALQDFGVSPSNRICLDAGSSAGGFTDCLVQHGATKVYAVDVTIGQLAWKLQRDPRVVPLEMNVRYLEPEDLAERPSLITADLSFISLSKVLPALASTAQENAEFLLLIKPQFELERGEVGAGGIVRDAKLQQRAIERVRKAAEACGLRVVGVKPSRVPGAAGNQEFFLHAVRSASVKARG